MEERVYKGKKRQGGAFWELLLVFLFPYILTLVWQGDLGVDPNYVSDEIVIRQKDGTMVALEDYVPGLAAAQLSTKLFAYSECEHTMLEVQSIIARTYLVGELKEADQRVIQEEELEETAWSRQEVKAHWGKVWYEQYYPLLTVSSYNTRGQVLCYENQILVPMYHFSSAGVTRNHPVFPYIRHLECKADYLAPDSLRLIYFDKKTYAEVTLWQIDEDGYCEEIALGDEHITSEEFAERFGVSTNYLQVEELTDAYRVIARGDGDGYGLSQWSANEMAAQGKSVKEIFSFFYPNCTIKNVK